MKEESLVKVVIWGTGGNAERFIKTFYNVLKFFVIVGIVDDNEKRAGSSFLGFRVKGISEINKMDFDYILRLDTYCSMEESLNCVPERYKKCVVNREEFLGKALDETFFFLKKRVVFIGKKTGFDYYAYGAKFFFKSFSFYEDDSDISDSAFLDVDYIMVCPDWFIDRDEEKAYEKSICLHLKNKYGVRTDKIIPFDVWMPLLTQCDRKIETGGTLNPDKRFMIIMQTIGSGWATMLMHYMRSIAYAKKKGMIPIIDMKNYRTQYISETDFGKKNVWDIFFQPISEYDLDDIYRSKNVYLCSTCAPVKLYQGSGINHW